MGKTITNLSIVLGIVTIAFAAYYLYVQKAPTVSDFEVNEQTLQNMLNNTRVFIQHKNTLNAISLNPSFFEDERLLSLRSFSTPVPEQPVGRVNPFAEIDALRTNDGS